VETGQQNHRDLQFLSDYNKDFDWKASLLHNEQESYTLMLEFLLLVSWNNTFTVRLSVKTKCTNGIALYDPTQHSQVDQSNYSMEEFLFIDLPSYPQESTKPN